jgi:Cdc6-like AAA superfamily ATPase
MNIKEVENEKKIVLSKFEFSCDDIDSSIPKPLPQTLNFFMLICGKPGSGKTTLLLNLIAKQNKVYNQKFDTIYVFSPSLTTIKDSPFDDLPEDQIFSEITTDNLFLAQQKIKDSGEKVLFILDDVVNDMKKQGVQTELSKMLMNRRHLAGAGGSSAFIITTQVYNKIPAPIRKTATQIVIYSTKNKKELDTIFEELILIPKDDFYQILQYCFDKPHNFIYINVNSAHDKMFHKNFNQLDFKSENVNGL